MTRTQYQGGSQSVSHLLPALMSQDGNLGAVAGCTKLLIITILVGVSSLQSTPRFGPAGRGYSTDKIGRENVMTESCCCRRKLIK